MFPETVGINRKTDNSIIKAANAFSIIFSSFCSFDSFIFLKSSIIFFLKPVSFETEITVSLS
jgi:hypothetical protein